MPLILTVLFFIGISASADDKPRFIAVEITVNARPSQSSIFEKVISNNIVFELEQAGFAVISVTHLKRTMIKKTQNRETLDFEQLLGLAREFNARFIMLADYDESGALMKIDFRCYDVARGELLQSLRLNRPKNVSLDVSVTEALRGIILKLDLEKLKSPAPERMAPANRQPDVTFYLSAAPFFPTGQAAGFLGVGIMSAVTAVYHVKFDASYLGLGLTAGADFLTLRDGYSQFDSLILPLGIDLRYGLQNNGTAGFYIHAGGGMAVLTIDVSGPHPRSKLIPYAAAGLGMTIPFSFQAGLALNASFNVFFEGTAPIMGFSPHGCVFISF